LLADDGDDDAARAPEGLAVDIRGARNVLQLTPAVRLERERLDGERVAKRHPRERRKARRVSAAQRLPSRRFGARDQADDGARRGVGERGGGGAEQDRAVVFVADEPAAQPDRVGLGLVGEADRAGGAGSRSRRADGVVGEADVHHDLLEAARLVGGGDRGGVRDRDEAEEEEAAERRHADDAKNS
jgi:hypothetical protein